MLNFDNAYPKVCTLVFFLIAFTLLTLGKAFGQDPVFQELQAVSTEQGQLDEEFSQAGLADPHANAQERDSVRGVFLYSGIGLIEVLTVGIGTQVSQDFSISLKYATTWIGKGAMILPNSATGIGLKLTYHKDLAPLPLNAISFDYILYLHSSLGWQYRLDRYDPFIKGHYFDINVGKETVNESGFHFFWGVGFCISAAKEASVLYAPSIKIGINFNFI
jgi:hypothetical protein